MKNLYRNFDLEDDKTFDELSKFYQDHINAIIAEELHSKSAIAWEFCYRDNKIAKLQAGYESLSRLCIAHEKTIDQSDELGAASTYFMLVEELLPNGGSLVEYVYDIKERLEQSEAENEALKAKLKMIEIMSEFIETAKKLKSEFEGVIL